jgi:hypothetical protein
MPFFTSTRAPSPLKTSGFCNLLTCPCKNSRSHVTQFGLVRNKEIVWGQLYFTRSVRCVFLHIRSYPFLEKLFWFGSRIRRISLHAFFAYLGRIQKRIYGTEIALHSSYFPYTLDVFSECVLLLPRTDKS